MEKLLASIERERFESGAGKYAAYLQTPEGRLRLDLACANLQEFLPPATSGLRALDIGGGTGAIAVHLAQLGIHVTVLDSSQPMLSRAETSAQEAAVTDRIALVHGDAAEIAELLPGSFDLILCHNILEYVDAPCVVLRGAVRMLRDSSSIISILVRNQAGEVLKAAIKDGDLDASERNLTADSAHESLYGGPVRLFSAESIHAMLEEASLAAIAERGVRVLSDYLPEKISRTDEYERVLELERKLGSRPDVAAVARYMHVIAHLTPATKDTE
jgi:S-adenosylmethionine-dependent methyltransferase